MASFCATVHAVVFSVTKMRETLAKCRLVFCSHLKLVAFVLAAERGES